MVVRNGTGVKFPSVPGNSQQGLAGKGLGFKNFFYLVTENQLLAEIACAGAVNSRRVSSSVTLGCLRGHQHLFEDVPAPCRWL